MSEKENPPPSYEEAIKEIAGQKQPTYRLFLHYNRKDVACALDCDANIEAIGSLNFYTENIPKSSIHPGSVPIEEITRAIDPNKFVTVVLEADCLGYLRGVIMKYYTCHKIWDYNDRKYMAAKFPLYHDYIAKSVKQILFHENKKAGFYLLIVTSSYNFFTERLTGIALYGSPQMKCKYALQITFRRPFTELKDCLLDWKGDSVTRYGTEKPAFKSIIFENDKVINCQVKAEYEGPTLDIVLKNPSIDCLKAIERYYMEMHIPNEEPHHQATVVSVYKESLESIEEESGSQRITVKFKNYSVLYHPNLSFGDPVSWDATHTYVLTPRKCEQCNIIVYDLKRPNCVLFSS